jgi:hypothetical protein
MFTDIDADSALIRPIDRYIRADDELVLGFEFHDYDADWCYSSHFRLSTLMQTSQLRDTLKSRNIDTAIVHDEKAVSGAMKSLFRGRMILNWCIMAAPRHEFLKNALENFVKIVELEFMGLSAIKMRKTDKFSKHIYCTTGPFMLTASCREAAVRTRLLARGADIRNLTQLLSSADPATSSAAPFVPSCEDGFLCKYRLASRDFDREGGLFKVVAVNKDPNHYTRAKHVPFLLRYANETIVSNLVKSSFLKEIDKQVIMGRAKPNIYYLERGLKRSIDSMDIFNKHNFDLVRVILLSDYVMSLIPEGNPLT